MTGPKNRVEVHSKLTVVSSTPVEPGKTYPLTVLDHAMARHTLHVIYYYRSGSFDLDRIRPPLNELLTLYPNVTGRLSRDNDGNWQIKCTDAGVRVLRARVGVTVDEWLRFADADEEMDLAVWEDMPDDPHIWSPFHIQVTEFEGGGAAISLSCPHLIADLTSAIVFFNSWSLLNRRLPLSHPPHLKYAAVSHCPTITTTQCLKEPPIKTQFADGKMYATTFNFSNSTIQQSLSKWAHLGPFDFLTALFWTRIAHFRKAHYQKQTLALSVCLDVRTRLSSPLPLGYFGNFIHFSNLSLHEDEVNGGDIRHVANEVRCHVDGFSEEHFWSTVDRLHSKTAEKGKVGPTIRMYGQELTCINMEHLMGESEYEPLMYKAGFDGEVGPVHVACRVGDVAGEGLIIVMPSPEGGVARRVTVVLPAEEVAALCDDEVIMRLEPTLLVSGGKDS